MSRAARLTPAEHRQQWRACKGEPHLIVAKPRGFVRMRGAERTSGASMLIPAIDLMGGKVVQLSHSGAHELEIEDFHPWIERFQKYPLVHLVDLDAVMHTGENRKVIAELCKRLPCQVGGGVRSEEDARRYLEYGAKRVVIGSALFHENSTVNKDFAQKMHDAVGRKCLVFSVDSRHGRVTINGWRTNLSISAEDAMKELEKFCAAFLCTNVDLEHTMGGFPMNMARDLRHATKRHLIVAGGIQSLEEVAQLDALDIDAMVGMALYKGVIQV